MRQWVVGSIIALILSVQLSSQALLLILLIVFSLLLLIHVLALRYGAIARIISLEGVGKRYGMMLCALVSVYYSYSWVDERLQSRLPIAMTGVVVDGLADVIDCRVVVNSALVKRSNKSLDGGSQASSDKKPVRGIEKVTLQVVSVAAADVILPPLETLVLNYYFQENASAQTVISKKAFGDEGCQAVPSQGRIQFQAKLRAPYSFINPYVFDYEAWQLSKGVDAGGYLKRYLVVESAKENLLPLRAMRQKGVERAATFDGLAGQVLPALLFGESGYLGGEIWSDLQMTGTVHLLIVSGLHVGFLAMLVLLLWRPLIKLEMLLLAHSRSYLLRITPLILLCMCLIYSYMAGMGLAVQRAGFMMAIALMVVYGKRQWSPFDTWLWVMWLILMINPLVSLFVGFWFSFTAVGALLVSYVGMTSIKFESSASVPWRVVKDSKKTQAAVKNRSWRRFWDVLYRPQWIVFLSLIPFLWMFQQSNSLLSFALNVVAIPLLACVILPLSLAVYVSANAELLALLNVLLDASFSVLNDVAQLSLWQIYKPSGVWLLCFVPVVWMTLLPSGFPFRYLCLLLVGLLLVSPSQMSKDRLWVLDVGQGLAVYGQVNGDEGATNWLYDTGAKYRSGFSLGEAVVAKHIVGAAGGGLERLFISHSDNDHAGGELGLKKKISIGHTLAGQPSTAEHINCHLYTKDWNNAAGYRWRILSVLASNEHSSEEVMLSDNNQSCVVQLDVRGVRVLLPGDVEKAIEDRLVRMYARELPSDILIVPHHGSKTSSSRAFVSAVNPTIAIVSSGYGNAFNHPHSSVISLFNQLKIPIYNTAISGAIEVNLDNVADVVEWRKKNPPKWRQM